MTPRFRDRTHAGQILARRLMPYANRPDTWVLGLPRGGIVVAFEVAQALHLPLDAFLVRKLGVPGQRELAMGAIASGGALVANYDLMQSLQVSYEDFEQVLSAEQQELERRDRHYHPAHATHQQLHLSTHSPDTIILVDDGIATGSTLQAALLALNHYAIPHKVIAVPVAPPTICDRLMQQGYEVVCLHMPDDLQSIGRWYLNFSQTTDDEVCALLDRARAAILHHSTS